MLRVLPSYPCDRTLCPRFWFVNRSRMVPVSLLVEELLYYLREDFSCTHSRCSGFELTRLAYVVCGGFHGTKKIKRIEQTKNKLRKRSLPSPKNAGHVVFCWSQMAPDAWADLKNLIDLASYSASKGNILLYVYNVYITYALICAQLYIYIKCITIWYAYIMAYA